MESVQETKKRGHKEARKANFLKKIWKGDQSTKASSFQKRKPTLMKKAMELSTLCEVDATVICYDANGNVDFWPPNLMEVNQRCFNYLTLNEKAKKEQNYLDLVQSKKRKLMKKTKGKMSVESLISSLSNRVGDKESVMVLESKIKSLKERIEFLKAKEKIAGNQIVQCQESDFSVEDLMIIGETKGPFFDHTEFINGDFGFEFGGQEMGLVNYGNDPVPLNAVCTGKDDTMGMIDYSDGQSFYSNWLIPSDCIASGQY